MSVSKVCLLGGFDNLDDQYSNRECISPLMYIKCKFIHDTLKTNTKYLILKRFASRLRDGLDTYTNVKRNNERWNTMTTDIKILIRKKQRLYNKSKKSKKPSHKKSFQRHQKLN